MNVPQATNRMARELTELLKVRDTCILALEAAIVAAGNRIEEGYPNEALAMLRDAQEHFKGDTVLSRATAETNCEEVMPDAGNSTKPDHVKPGVASGDNTPQCFFCARPLESHYDNAQGHPWRRGSRVTVADLAINRQTETACGEKPPIGFGVPTLADRVKAVMAETGAGYESALQTVAEECELRSEAIFAVRQYFDYYEPEQKNG